MGGLTAAAWLARRGRQVLVLEAAFHELGEELSSHITLQRVKEIYQVEIEDGPTVKVLGSIEATAAGLDKTWPGAGERYAQFVERVGKVLEDLLPLQFTAKP